MRTSPLKKTRVSYFSSCNDKQAVILSKAKYLKRLYTKHYIMKKIWFLLSNFLCLFGISFANGLDPMNLPKFQHFVNDYSQVLTQEQFQELNQLAKSIETNSGHQVVTVLFPHREGNELFDIVFKAFNENGIGDKERNDGLLLAIATEEKKIRIMVWYGLEGEVPDALASRIIETLIRPEVNSWNFYQAVKNFYTYFTDEEVKSELAQQLHNEKYKYEGDDPLKTFLGFLIFVFITRILIKGGGFWEGGGYWGNSSWDSWWGDSGNSWWDGFSGGWGSSWWWGAGD